MNLCLFGIKIMSLGLILSSIIWVCCHKSLSFVPSTLNIVSLMLEILNTSILFWAVVINDSENQFLCLTVFLHFCHFQSSNSNKSGWNILHQIISCLCCDSGFQITQCLDIWRIIYSNNMRSTITLFFVMLYPLLYKLTSLILILMATGFLSSSNLAALYFG